MRVLVTGANGQLGGALQRAAPEGTAITALGAEQCDLTDSDGLRATIDKVQPDILINAAAFTAVDKAESNEAKAHTINAEAVGIMAEAMAERGGKLVHISTDFVFDGEASSAYRPGDARAPVSVYGRTKAEGEDRLSDHDLLIRTSWVYEAGGANFVRTMIRLMKERDELGVVCDQIGAPTWATSLARAIWGLVDIDAKGEFHFSDAGVASWYDFAVAIAEEARALELIESIPIIRPIKTAEYPTPARRPKFSLLDSSGTHEALGNVPIHWRTNLRHMLNEEKALG